ncbi:MAG: glutathione S-transferase family protein, partial [Chloroflexota bacterium]
MGIRLYGRSTSFNVLKVGWLLDELALEYEHIQLGGRYGGLDTPEFGALNPIRKVPTLVDGEKRIWESHTILRYLAAEYGPEGFLPADPYGRSLQERWMDWSQSVFQPAFIGIFWGYYRKPPSRRDMGAVQQQVDKAMFHLDAFNLQLADSRFLVGDTFSAADIPAGSVLYRLS